MNFCYHTNVGRGVTETSSIIKVPISCVIAQNLKQQSKTKISMKIALETLGLLPWNNVHGSIAIGHFSPLDFPSTRAQAE
jgi:hypothetical protein